MSEAEQLRAALKSAADVLGYFADVMAQYLKHPEVAEVLAKAEFNARTVLRETKQGDADRQATG